MQTNLVEMALVDDPSNEDKFMICIYAATNSQIVDATQKDDDDLACSFDNGD